MLGLVLENLRVRLCPALKLHFLIVLFHAAVEVVREKGFHLDVEDYLAGVLIMASELVSPHFSKGPFYEEEEEDLY